MKIKIPRKVLRFELKNYDYRCSHRPHGKMVPKLSKPDCNEVSNTMCEKWYAYIQNRFRLWNYDGQINNNNNNNDAFKNKKYFDFRIFFVRLKCIIILQNETYWNFIEAFDFVIRVKYILRIMQDKPKI